MGFAIYRMTVGPIACMAVGLWSAFMPASAMGQAEVVNQIGTNLFIGHHTNLFVHNGQNRGFTYPSQSSVPRVPANQHNPARDYIYARFSGFGLSTTLDPFAFTTRFGSSPTYAYTNCNNVIATKQGTDPQHFGVYVIGAYYDAVDPGQPLPSNMKITAPLSPSADENGSGVAGMLAIADVLSRQTFKATIIFIAFDASEKNFGGVYHYVYNLTTADSNDTSRIYRGNIRSMVSLDTIAYNPAGANYNVALISGGYWTNGGACTPTNAPIRVALAAAVAEFAGLPAYQATNNYWSDHLYFQNEGVDSCTLEERSIWSNTYAYGVNDSVDTPGYLDYDYAVMLTRALAGYLCRHAELIYSLTIGTNGNGSVSGSNGWQAAGSSTTLVATAGANWHFVGWTGNTNGCFQAGNVITAVMTQVRSITAIFTNTQQALSLTVNSAYGGATPGSLVTNYGATVIESVTNSPVLNGATQHVCVGAAVSGNGFTQLSATNVTLTLTNNATLTWNWRTNVLFTRTAAVNGSLVGATNGWYALGSAVTVTPVPDSCYRFLGWTGDVPSAQTNSNPLILTLDRSRSIQAIFVVHLEAMGTPDDWLDSYGLTNLPFAEEELLDRDGDGAAAWQEYVANTDPTDGMSYLRFVAISNRPTFAVYFSSVTDRVYTLDYSTNLSLSNGWLGVPGRSNIWGNNGVTAVGVADSPGSWFYRVRVRLPP